MRALEAWGEMLQGWGIPDEIQAKVPESPWRYPAELMRHRAAVAVAGALSPSAARALEALPERGTVIDVGVGGGAASLPLAHRAGLMTGIDTSGPMLEGFREAAASAGVEARVVLGLWPDVAAKIPLADVVVCNHVLYNVRDLEPFVAALDSHARRRVVVEITERHPLAWMGDLWLRFHGLERPSGPTASDAVAALEELDIPVQREDRQRETSPAGFEHREDAVALTRRRLCLPAERDAEIAEALGGQLARSEGLWSAGPAHQVLVTLWWDRP
jgi:SAM-dependent methyltransferase